MDSFLENNKQKLGFAFKTTSVIFLTIIFIILIIGYFKNQLPDIWLFLTIIFFAGLLFPIFIIGLAFINWIHITRIRKRIYGLSPFDKLSEIGFSKSFINSENKWYFTEEIKSGQIHEFEILCDAIPRVILFTALVDSKKLDRIQFRTLRKRLKQHDIFFNFEGITKQYQIKHVKGWSIEELKKDLFLFTEILKQENFKPKIKNGSA